MPSVEQRPLKFIIVGAGIAGLAAARALREHDVVVLEQSRMKSEIGAAIHLGPNASKIGLAWGMNLEKLGSPECVGYNEFVAESGKVQIQAKMDPRELFGAPWLLNHRVDLHNELRRLATLPKGEMEGTPARIQSSAKVTAIDCDHGTVTLEDGEVLSADVIIGADGIHSVIRTEVLGDRVVAQPSGHSAYRCLIPGAVIASDPELSFLVDPGSGKEGAITAWIARDRRVVVYPCRNFEFLNVVAIIPDVFLNEASVESWSAEGSVSDLVAAFASFAPKVQRLLGYAPSCGLWQLRDQDPLPTWVKGNTILIGDAAHAMLPRNSFVCHRRTPHIKLILCSADQGQGGSQSFEDAEAIAAVFSGIQYIEGIEATIHERLLVVEKLRKERASKIQGYSRTKALGVKVGNSWSADPNEFSTYNFSYSGAVEWGTKHGIQIQRISV